MKLINPTFEAIKCGAVRRDDKGYYYVVPTTVRRSGKKRISEKTYTKYLKQINKIT